MKQLTTLLFALIFCTINLNAQCSLACNDQVFVSLSQDGSAKIYPDTFLEGDYTGCDLDLRISLADVDGNILEFPSSDFIRVTCLYLGDNIITIEDRNTGNKCWGTITVEDQLDICELGCNLNCNDNINVSLDDDGLGVLTPDVFLEGGYWTCDSDLVIKMEDNQGNIIHDYAPTLYISCDDLGIQSYTVMDLKSGNSCWGELNIEDKIGSCDANCNDDTASPIPYLLNLSTALVNNGEITLWAIDFNQGSYDLCDDELSFTFSDVAPASDPDFDPSIGSSSRVFDCNDYQSTSDHQIQITIYVWDDAGNVDFGIVNLLLVDNLGNCENVDCSSFSCQDMTVSTSPWSCAATIGLGNLVGTNYSNCDLSFTIVDELGTVQTGEVEEGIYLYQITDNGNGTTCEAMLVVEDATAPVAIVSQTTTAIMENGEVELYASDFDNGSYDCTDVVFTFSDIRPDVDPDFDASIGSSRKTFTCSDWNNGESIDVFMYVWDDHFNYNSTWTELTLVDSDNFCEDQGDCNLACTGNVVVSLTTGSGGGDPTAKVFIESLVDGDFSACGFDLTVVMSDFDDNTILMGEDFLTLTCEHIGQYKFSVLDWNTGNSCWGTITIEDKINFCLLEGPHVLVTEGTCIGYDLDLNSGTVLSNTNQCAFKVDESDLVASNTLEIQTTENTLHGISTLDLVIFREALLSGFDNPKQAIASDVNSDGVVSTFDLVNMLRLILGIDDISEIDLHKILRTDHVFDPNFDPFNFGNNYKNIEFTDAEILANNLPVCVVKVMDVDGSGLVGEQTVSSRGIRTIKYKDQNLVAGSNYEIDFTLDDGIAIKGLLLSLEIPGAILNDLTTDYSEAEVVSNLIQEKALIAFLPSTESDNFTMTLSFTANANGKLSDLLMKTDDLSNDVVNHLDESDDLQFETDGTTSTEELNFSTGMKTYPNPSIDQMTLAFDSSYNGLAKEVVIYNTSGQLVYQKNTKEDQIVLFKNDFDQSILLIQVKIEDKIFNDRLIFID